MDWHLPVYQPKAQASDGRSVSVQARRALSVAEAFAQIAGEDPRPLLVLRECLSCNGTDDALLTRQADNERTLLMSQWFHCVKLPPAVLEEDHPFHALFADEDPGHLFVARSDGTGRIDLRGDQSRTELWSVLGSRLSSDYQRKPAFDRSLRGLLKLLDRFDSLDQSIARLEERVDAELEDARPNARKLLKLRAQLEKERAELAKARAEASEVAALQLREPPKDEAPSGAAAPEAG